MTSKNVPDLGTISYGHPSIDEVMQWFAYAQLPPHLQEVSKPIGDLAHSMALEIGEAGGPELTKGLAKLLEAKDCLVRAALRRHRLQHPQEEPKTDAD